MRCVSAVCLSIIFHISAGKTLSTKGMRDCGGSVTGWLGWGYNRQLASKKIMQMQTEARRALREHIPPLKWILSRSGVQVQTWDSDPDDFQNLMGTFLSKHMSVIKTIKFLWRWDQFFQRYEPDALSHNVEESFRNILGPDTDADDFQNLISFFLSTLHLW